MRIYERNKDRRRRFFRISVEREIDMDLLVYLMVSCQEYPDSKNGIQELVKREMDFSLPAHSSFVGGNHWEHCDKWKSEIKQAVQAIEKGLPTLYSEEVANDLLETAWDDEDDEEY